ncbi:hypothetical protein BJX68DRAFT_135587 [Aspergillus pseudodeflectus]|uniref:JmjC domain-containing protein n=1 Tax=Aspergillus pseudodeflectus TaxID=176178 RepID=A0ABR4JZC3_9EURO
MKIPKCSLQNNSVLKSQCRAESLSRPSPSRRWSSQTVIRYKPLQALDDGSINTFREEYFKPERPVILPHRSLRDIPAYSHWFYHSPTEPSASRLNVEYLEQHGANALVPLELTQSQPQNSEIDGHDGNSQLSFRKFHAPLSLFLQWIRDAETQSQPSSTRLYLAQCQLLDLPQTLRNDIPTPRLVAESGKGDIYDTNIWVGYPPTYTPLHRDPNPNLFVQLAGRKVVRLLAPQDGQAVFARVRRQLGRSGGRDATVFRGEEMMQGRERDLLERGVWGDVHVEGEEGETCEGFEAELEVGDGLFIPKGWWHSIKGVGTNVTASVNWWFR